MKCIHQFLLSVGYREARFGHRICPLTFCNAPELAPGIVYSRILFVGLSIFILFSNIVALAELPDLIIGSDNPYLSIETFEADSCEVVEGCILPGTRRLLRFGTTSANIGSGDLTLGNPTNNSLFHFQTCHGHYHFQQWAEYRLRNSAGNLVATGTKAGFCVEDRDRIRLNSNPVPIYDCSNQGIQAGWSDYYGSFLACQWIDVTGIAAGVYTLELEIDPAHLIQESDHSNNISRLRVAIDAPSAIAPSNDSFSSAEVISGSSALILAGNSAASKEPAEPLHAGNPGGHSLWYKWKALKTGPVILTTEGSTFHTLLAVYHGNDLANLTLDGSDGQLNQQNTSVSFDATTGVDYYIAVDGFDGATGGLLLTVNPDQLTPPRIEEITFAGASGAHFTLTGSPGDRYEIQSSSNLVTWAPIGLLTNLMGTIQFTDLDATNAMQRFYRAVIAPLITVPTARLGLVGISEQAWQASDVWVPATQSREVSGSKTLITLGGWWDERNSATPMPTDSNGTFLNGLSQNVGLANAPVQVQVGYQTAAVSGSHVVTPPVIGTSGDGFFLLLEADGLATNSPVRDTGQARQSHPFYGFGDPDTIQSITVTTDGATAQVGDLAVAMFVMDNNSNPNIQITLPAGWTSLGFNNAAVDNVGYRACYKLVTTPGTQTATCSWTDDSTFVAEGAMVVFKAATNSTP